MNPTQGSLAILNEQMAWRITSSTHPVTGDCTLPSGHPASFQSMTTTAPASTHGVAGIYRASHLGLINRSVHTQHGGVTITYEMSAGSATVAVQFTTPHTEADNELLTASENMMNDLILRRH